MARIKLTDEQKAEKKKQEELDRIQANLESNLKDIRTHYYPTNPTRKFEVGQEVKCGGFDYVEVIEVLDDGLIYKLSTHLKNRDGVEIRGHYASWADIQHKRDIQPTSIREEDIDDLNIQFLQQSISSLHSYLYYFGIDMNPEYQRDYVWEMSDKVNLIHSIFNKIDIGRFVFIRRPYGERKELYEVLDGKQRLSALKDFIEDRFTYQGKLFSELSFGDQCYFNSFGIVVGQVESHSNNPVTLKQKLKYFLKINTVGKVMDLTHLEKIKEQLNNLQGR